jgi:hypothetical protein
MLITSSIVIYNTNPDVLLNSIKSFFTDNNYLLKLYIIDNSDFHLVFNPYIIKELYV